MQEEAVFVGLLKKALGRPALAPAMALALALATLAPAIVGAPHGVGPTGSNGVEPDGAKKRSTPFEPRQVRGIDVSHHQGRIRWREVAGSGHRFVFAKATEGRNWVDPTYLENKAGAERHDLVFGAYHFAHPEPGRIDAIREANHFVEEARLRPGNLMPVLDLETTGGLNHRQLTRWILTWLRQVRDRLGVRPIVYTSPVGWALRTGDTAAIARAGFEHLWVAHWGVHVPALPADRWGGHGWTFWQRSACGSVPGIRGCVDVDVAGRALETTTIPTGVDEVAPTVRVAPPGEDGAIAVTFDEPVVGVSRSTVLLRATQVADAPPFRLACRSDYGTPLACERAGVRSVAVVPRDPLLPGEVFDVVVDDAIADIAGNPLARTVEAVAPPVDLEQGSAAIVYRWPVVERDNAIGGSYVAERRPGATASFAFHGSDVTWITAKGPDMGAASVWIDGRRVADVDLRAERSAFGVGRRFDRLGPGPHVIEIRVLGVGPRGVTPAPVVVDAFRTGRGTTPTPSLQHRWAMRSRDGERLVASAVAGASAEVTFSGTGLRWRTAVGPRHGMAGIWVDGAFLRTLDTGTKRKAARVERIEGLPDGEHTVRIVVLGVSRGSAGSVPAVSIDGFSVVA